MREELEAKCEQAEEAIRAILQAFYMDTGLTPAAVSITVVDTSTTEARSRFVANVRLEVSR